MGKRADENAILSSSTNLEGLDTLGQLLGEFIVYSRLDIATISCDACLSRISLVELSVVSCVIASSIQMLTKFCEDRCVSEIEIDVQNQLVREMSLVVEWIESLRTEQCSSLHRRTR